MTGNSVTATVEVLTAEVRVLMVGSRQVTLSVYRQLDRVKRHECEPFGRVRDGREEGHGVSVVGRHRVSGALVSAGHERPTSPYCWNQPVDAELKNWCVTGPLENPYYQPRRPAHIATLGDYRVIWIIPQDAPTDESMPPGSWRFSTPEKEQQALAIAQQQLEAIAASVRHYTEWAALPLIVLAGLR